MDHSEQWLDWAVELQAIAQAGLHYGRDVFDRERYQRIRDIAAEMICHKTDISPEKVRQLFCSESGYQTPKLDTRAAIFRGEEILLVQELDGLWALPGGWVDAGLSVGENAVKEVREEAGLESRAERIIAILDREKHTPQVYAWKISKVFVLCTALGGAFAGNTETTASGYFPLTALPPLAEEKTTREQVAICFDAYHAEHWVTIFD